MRQLHALACIASVAFAVLSAPATAAPAESLTVVFDQARVVTIPQSVATVVIGNPAIADATIQNNKLLVVTGKGFGATNIMLLDPGGQMLAEYVVRVIGQRDDTVTVFRGADRMTYACSPRCETTTALGDSDKYFEMVLKQSDARDKQAIGTSSAAAPR